MSDVGVSGFSSSHVGVEGISATGVAGRFQGGRAQLWLLPAATTGQPTTGGHQLGELFLDQTGALYLCKTAGTPGIWKKLG